MDLPRLQAALQTAHLDAWLFYDHHGRDPLALQILGLEPTFTSRRWFYLLPAHGEPQKLVHRIESGKLDPLPGPKTVYSSWQELESSLASMLEGATTVAMQYSPRNAIMYVSMVDAGTVELVRSFGKTVVSSADLLSQFAATLTEAQINTHFEAQRRLDPILKRTWQRLGALARANQPNDEFATVQWLLSDMQAAGLWTDHGPNVSAGPNSADSHYEPTPATSRPIRSGDFILIDCWARLADPAHPSQPLPNSIWYDITWTGVLNREPTPREAEIFTLVRDAREAAIARVQSAFAQNQPIHGYQADDAARDLLRSAGQADWFTHRTGHNITAEIHGPGAHLDNLETHDERLILPFTCFSVEPGLYFPGEFGIRSEINMITRPGEALVTGPRQAELLRL